MNYRLLQVGNVAFGHTYAVRWRTRWLMTERSTKWCCR